MPKIMTDRGVVVAGGGGVGKRANNHEFLSLWHLTTLHQPDFLILKLLLGIFFFFFFLKSRIIKP